MDTLKQYIKVFLTKTFSQQDPAWRNETLGNSGTIGAYGCLETDATVVANYFQKGDFNPSTMNKKLIEAKAYDGNLFNWYAFATLFGLKFSDRFFTPQALTATQMNQIRSQLDKKYPVFLQIDTIPATAGLDEHWILAIGYDGDDFIVFDPWDGSIKRITSWGVKPQEIIYMYCWYEAPVPTQSIQTMEIAVTERDWLVGRATTAKEVATYLAIDNPDNAPTEAYTKVVAGIKSTTTATQTELTNTKIELAKANQEIANKEEQVARLKIERQESDKYYLAQIDNLNGASKANAKIFEEAQGRIKALEGQVKAASEAKGQAQNETAEYKAKLETCQAGQKVALTVWDWIKNMLKRK